MTIRTKNKARRLTRAASAVIAGLVTTLLAAPAYAGRTAVLNFTCDLGGAPAQLTMQVEIVASGGFLPDGSGGGTVVPLGEVTYYTQGTLTSATGRYSFHGENEFADFVDQLTNDRFRVRMIADGQQLMLIINPEGPGPRPHLCRLSGPVTR